MVHLAVVAFIVVAGLSQAEGSNMTNGGFAPFGARGVWNGAALVFFSYIGFDAVATTAEEVRAASLSQCMLGYTCCEAEQRGALMILDLRIVDPYSVSWSTFVTRHFYRCKSSITRL